MWLCFYLLSLFIGFASLESSESECGAYPTQPKAKSTPGSLDMALVKGTYRTGLEYFSLYPQICKVKTSAFLLLIIGERSIQTLQLCFPDSWGQSSHLSSVTRFQSSRSEVDPDLTGSLGWLCCPSFNRCLMSTCYCTSSCSWCTHKPVHRTSAIPAHILANTIVKQTIVQWRREDMSLHRQWGFLLATTTL